MTASVPTCDYDYVRSRLLNREEIAFLDVREEAPHAEGHPLFAANFPYSQIELNVFDKLPRKDVPVVVIDSGEGLAEAAASRLSALGYSNTAVFKGGISVWQEAGGELFIDVNVPSKAFGEMMEADCHTPSLPAEKVKALIDRGKDMVIVDVRRFDEYQTMCIPTATSVPGAELVLRLPDLVPNPDTQIIINCAGRTRGLIGTQSVINAGFPNPVAALRNGTIGWTLARQQLDHGQSRSFRTTTDESLELAKKRSRQVADQAGVKRAGKTWLGEWSQQQHRTTCFFDVRTIEEYRQGHLPGFYPAPGGQLVQETEMLAPVRGARIVLTDDNGVRANMTASWLAQMAWDVYVLDDITAADLCVSGDWQAVLPAFPDYQEVSATALFEWLQSAEDVAIIDLSKYASYVNGHIPGAWYLLRSQLDTSISNIPRAARYVISSDNGLLAKYAAHEIAQYVEADVFVLSGGNQAWTAQGYQLQTDENKLASDPVDRYQRPYEGTDVSREAMQNYLDWEFGLIEQMRRDGTHHFKPMKPEKK